MSDSLSLLEPWYKDGLRFGCTQCGKCCTGSPGYVWVNEDEIVSMAKFLNITAEEFAKKYLRKVGTSLSLIEDPTNFDCVFLKNKMCQVYGARPRNCRTFPFWPEHLESKEGWEEARMRCEGIHEEAPLISLEEIHKQIAEEN
jgi:uncharacterized protein